MKTIKVTCPKPNCTGELLPDGITATHEYYKCSVCKELYEQELPPEMEGINLFMI